jgi:GT2 family glycosyltransferase
MPELQAAATDTPPPDVSVILINWRMREDLEKCLEWIDGHVHQCRAETIVVNKPSGDGTEEMIARRFPWARLVEHPTFGFATMRNEGIRHARGRYYLVLDTDIEIRPGCFDALVRFMDRNPRLAGCGGHTTRLDGQVEYNVKRFYDLPTVLVRRSPLMRWWPNNPWNYRHQMMDKDHERPFHGDWMAGACFCMRREAVAQVGLFDESMHYFEDVDWCWRAKQAGWGIAFCPHGRIIHKVQGLSRKGWNRNTLIHLKSGLRFWWKLHHKGLDWASPARPSAPPRTATTPPKPDLPDASLIIISYNQPRLLAECLESLPAGAPRHRQEVIVVDNASTDDSADVAERWQSPDGQRATVIRNRRNLGFTKANNQGIARATGRYLVLLNNDTVVHPGALSAAIDYLDQHPDIGAAGLRLLNADGSLQLSCRRFPSFTQALFNRYSLLTRLFPNNRYSREYLMTDEGHDTVRDVDWVSGACLVIRRETLEQVGLLDERFFMYSEDVDYCFRVWQAGWRVTYLPFAEVVHYIGQSTSRNRTKTIVERHRSMFRFYRKHYSRGLMFLDVLTGAMVGARCGLHLALAHLPGTARR